MRYVSKSQFACRVVFPGTTKSFMRTILPNQVILPQGGSLYSVAGQAMHIEDFTHLVDNGFVAPLDAPAAPVAQKVADAEPAARAQENPGEPSAPRRVRRLAVTPEAESASQSPALSESGN